MGVKEFVETWQLYNKLNLVAISQFHYFLTKQKLVLLIMKDPTTAFVLLENMSIINDQASIPKSALQL
jgi:hypothetical protein